MSVSSAESDRRSVAALGVLLAVLLLILVAVGYFFVRVLVPAGCLCARPRMRDDVGAFHYGYGRLGRAAPGTHSGGGRAGRHDLCDRPSRGRVLAFHTTARMRA